MLNLKTNIKPVLFALLTILILTLATGCSAKDKTDEEASGSGDNIAAAAVDTENAIHIQIDVKDAGIIKADLYPGVAPVTVANFVKLVSDGFYDGLTFHRVMNDFMIQSGDPLGTGMGGSEEKIVGEFSNNGTANDLSHKRGVLSMARAGNNMDSASSQFFIVQADALFLDGDYAAFGMVTEGMDVVDAIALNTPVEDDNGTVKPENQPVITSIKILE